MFTGIVQGTAKVVAIEEKADFRTHTIRLPQEYCTDLQPGASVAHNGCCLTVTRVADDLVSFDLIRETLRVTNLGALRIGDSVNFERAARFGDEIGGHQMSGHILATAEITEIEVSEDNRRLRIRVPAALARYLFSKGYIGIDGISLTIGEVRGREFDVNLIPETLQRTNIGTRRVGDRLNIEIDPQTQAIVDTVERIMTERFSERI